MLLKGRARRIVGTIFLLSFIVGGAFAQNSTESYITQAYDQELLEIIQLIQKGQLDSALSSVNQHITRYPKSRVAQLLKADVLLAMSSPINDIGASATQPSLTAATQQKVLDGLKHQIKNRWSHAGRHAQLTNGQVPSSLVDMGRHRHVMVADLEAGRLFLYANNAGKPVLLRDYYLSVGSAGYGKQVEGDNKTPVGVYSIYKHIDSRELPDLYGDGAFPVDYPNRLDRYRNRTGYGIWLHGTPSDTYARSPWASEGCFVLSNADLQDIAQFVDVNQRTPVILSDSISWISEEALLKQRERYYAVLAKWRTDWESLDNDAYLAHYSNETFNFGEADFDRWAQRKKTTNDKKTFVQLDIDIESLFVYPGEREMFVVKYRQRYLSNNYHAESAKEQYWQKDQTGRWRIVYEG